MKPWIALTAVFVAACLGQDLEQHNRWMKDSKDALAKLSKSIEAKQGDEAAGQARRLADISAGLEQFWAKRNAQDAVKFSQDSSAAAKVIAEAAPGGKWDTAPSAVNTIKQGCQGCHKAHRERLPDGKYKIKGT